jgi:hypothetical protein
MLSFVSLHHRSFLPYLAFIEDALIEDEVVVDEAVVLVAVALSLHSLHPLLC